jgi:hypothetical protein
MKRDSSFSIVMGYELDVRGLIPGRGRDSIQAIPGAHPVAYPMATRGTFLHGQKCEDDHSPQPST